MGSDSLEKPDRQGTLVMKFGLYRDKLFVHLQRSKPRSWKPWILLPDLVLSCVALLWVLVSGPLSLVRAFLSKALVTCWSRTTLAPLSFIWTNIVSNSMKVYIRQLNWAHIGFKVFSRILLALYAWLAIALWHGSPWGPGGQWPANSVEEVQYVSFDTRNYFNNFGGATICNIRATDLYNPPIKTDGDHGYCNTRAALLEAMSDGGRHGFDKPYVPNGCHYRWFPVQEICAILDRFDALVFIGDQNLEMIYAGLNILLRRDLQHGALTQEIPPDKRPSCSCNSQFSNPGCHEYFVRNSKEISTSYAGSSTGGYKCQRMTHAMLSSQLPISAETLIKFQSLVRTAPPSNYKPIPIVHSLTSDASIEAATKSLDIFLGLADASKRKTPMLWIGPTAAGHIEIKGRKGNQEIWRFATEMARIAKEKDVETLGLWNLTIQAESYDGKEFGEAVSIVSAMMAVNWLARLESS